MLEAVRAHAPDAAVVAVSSGEVYGPPVRIPVTETAPLHPQNPYAVSKASTDLLARFYADAHGLRVTIARAFNHAGPGQEPIYAIASFAKQAAEGDTITTGNPDTRRDYTDVRDVVRAYRLLAEHGTPGEAYNVCSGRTASAKELVADARREGAPHQPGPRARARGDGGPRLGREAARGHGMGTRDPARRHPPRHRRGLA